MVNAPDPKNEISSRGTTPGEPTSAKEGRMLSIEQEPGQSVLAAKEKLNIVLFQNIEICKEIGACLWDRVLAEKRLKLLYCLREFPLCGLFPGSEFLTTRRRTPG
jgi:hypothetical protein